MSLFENLPPLVETGWLAEHLNDPRLVIVDARWRGDGNTTGLELYRAGHIPGAVNITSSTNLNPADWTYLPVAELQEKAAAAGLEASQRIITYCGVGISASLGLFSLYLAGFRNLGLYDASWEEWGTDSALPIEKSLY